MVCGTFAALGKPSPNVNHFTTLIELTRFDLAVTALTDGWTDIHYQTYYLPIRQSIFNWDANRVC